RPLRAAGAARGDKQDDPQVPGQRARGNLSSSQGAITMIIAIPAAGTLELKENDDFKGFKIVAEKPGATDAEIADALKGVGALDAEHKHAWITQAAMKNWGG